MVNKLRFFRYMDTKDGKLAQLETIADLRIPLNVCIDNAGAFPNLKPGLCTVDVCGVSGDVRIFPSEEAYRAADLVFASRSLVPIGTFVPGAAETDSPQTPHILFSGQVRKAVRNPEDAPDEPNWELDIETLELDLTLYCRTEETVRPGDLVHATAWLFGDLWPEAES